MCIRDSPSTFPIKIIAVVEIIFKTNFWAVPAFILELPVITSGPTSTTTGYWQILDKGLPGLHVMQPVGISFWKQFLIAPNTYGVVPEAAIPTTKSFLFMLCFCKSFHPFNSSSSAFSILFLIALSPPAIIPFTRLLLTPKVGGHSDASTTPNLPLVPDPI